MRGTRSIVGLDPNAPLHFRAEIEVAASPSGVWNQLTQVALWPRWHRGIRFAFLRGPLAPGTPLQWLADGMRISSLLAEVEEPRRLGWTIHTFGARGYLRWTLDAAGGARTRVVLEESWEGIAVRLLSGTLRKTVERSRREWLEGLARAAARAEAPEEED